MANTFLTIDMIAKEALMILRKNAVMAGLVHRDYSKEYVAGVGDTITIRKPATFTVKDFVESTGITVQDATEEKQTVKMDKFYDVSFAVTSKDLTMNISDFSAQLLVPAMMAFRDKIDAEIIKVAETATHTVTHAEGLIAPADVISARKLLNDGATPLSMRSLVVGTQAEADLLSSELFVSADKVGDTEGLKEASLGRKFGFDTYVDQNVGKKSLAFHKNALAFVTRPLALPQGNKESAIVNYDGFGLRVVKDYDINKKKDIISIDMVCGVALLNNDMIAIINDTRA